MWNVFLVSSNSVSSTPCSPYTPDSYWSLSDVKCPKKVTKSLFGDSLLILVCNIYWYSVSITSTSFTIIPYHSSPWWCDWVHNKWVNSFLVQCTICMFLCCHHQPPEPLSNCLLGMGVGWVWGGCGVGVGCTSVFSGTCLGMHGEVRRVKAFYFHIGIVSNAVFSLVIKTCSVCTSHAMFFASRQW